MTGAEQLDTMLCARERPVYEAQEEAAWQAHRAEVYARAVGIAIVEAELAESSRPLLRDLLALTRHAAPHPFDTFLEASLLESRFGRWLEPVHAAARVLENLYAKERLRLIAALYGDLPFLSEEALVAAGLDPGRAPDWKVIHDRL